MNDLRRWLAGWLSAAGFPCLADHLWPPYPHRQRTATVTLVVGEPELWSDCLKCSRPAYTWPITGIMDSGVFPAGEVTACPECDAAPEIVQRFLEARGWGN